jgi:magnesium-transporting ATPase (P-type)
VQVEMSSLTGEADAIEIFADRRSDIANEARNIVFNSSLVMEGDAWGVVYRTGDNTYIGTIAGLASATSNSSSSMDREIFRLVAFVTVWSLVIACTLFGISMGRKLGVSFSIVYGFVLVLVANVPEGLPSTIVAVLGLAAQLMAKENIFIKRTAIIETLGSATVIASDKTGTLTLNQMTVENVWTNRSFSSAAKVGVSSPADGRLEAPLHAPQYDVFLSSASAGPQDCPEARAYHLARRQSRHGCNDDRRACHVYRSRRHARHPRGVTGVCDAGPRLFHPCCVQGPRSDYRGEGQGNGRRCPSACAAASCYIPRGVCG